MIILIDLEKCDKIQHPKMIKPLKELETTGNLLNLIKTIYKTKQNPTVNTVCSDKRLND